MERFIIRRKDERGHGAVMAGRRRRQAPLSSHRRAESPLHPRWRSGGHQANRRRRDGPVSRTGTVFEPAAFLTRQVLRKESSETLAIVSPSGDIASAVTARSWATTSDLYSSVFGLSRATLQTRRGSYRRWRQAGCPTWNCRARIGSAWAGTSAAAVRLCRCSRANTIIAAAGRAFAIGRDANARHRLSDRERG